MLVFQGDKIRVMYDTRNQIYAVQKWTEGDNPRSYGRHYDYYTVKQFKNSSDVVAYLDEVKEENL